MTIDKAIKCLENYPIGASPDEDIDFQKGIQLGIEALKLLAQEPPEGYSCIPRPLPSETTGSKSRGTQN